MQPLFEIPYSVPFQSIMDSIRSASTGEKLSTHTLDRESLQPIQMDRTFGQRVANLFRNLFLAKDPLEAQREQIKSPYKYQNDRDAEKETQTDFTGDQYIAEGQTQAKFTKSQSVENTVGEKPDTTLNPLDTLPTSSSSNDSWVDRRDMNAIRSIENAAFEKLLRERLDPKGRLNADDCHVVKRTEGTFHHCAILSLTNHGNFVIKVPFHGVKDIWGMEDAHNLRSEAFTMSYIRRYTSVPVPEVIAFDDWLVNTISAPYILMRAINGIPAHGLWIHTNPDGSPDYLNADLPSPALNQRRRKFLKSLAYTMAELQKLKFSQIGMLELETQVDDTENGINPIQSATVSSWWREQRDGSLTLVSSCESSDSYWKSKLNEFKTRYCSSEEGDFDDHLWGMYIILERAVNTWPLNKSIEDKKNKEMDSKETFVLRHNDLDLQNIFVNKEGEIVGIIDWDLTLTAPRCVASASLPVFLREDLHPSYDILDAQHMPWILEEYRQLYAKYMIEATRSTSPESGHLGDGKYTAKSHLYNAAYRIGIVEGAEQHFVDLMFKEIPALRHVDQDAFLERLGSENGWTEAEHMLKVELKKLFAC